MSAIDELREDIRQKLFGDSRYTREYPYAFEVRVPISAGLPSVFVFPIGPDALSVKRVFAQAVTPTLGGVVAEEDGYVWHDITVAGSFGLNPKKGYDTTAEFSTVEGMGPIAPYTTLSGPLWVRRMLRNVFDRYAELKADPKTSADTYLIWHNFKEEDSQVVIPREIDLNRTTATRAMYPFSLQLRAIAPASSIKLPPDELGVLGKFLAAVQSVIRTAARALALVQGAIQEATQVLGEVRYFVATVDALFDTVGRIVDAAEDFVGGVSDTIDVALGVLGSAAAALDAVLDALQSTEPNASGVAARGTVPPEIRQVFAEMQDGIHLMASQTAAFARSYDTETAALAVAGAGLAGADPAVLAEAEAAPATTLADLERQSTRSGDRVRREAGAAPQEREYPRYTAFEPYLIVDGDTIQGIAARQLGSGQRWYDIAVINQLQPPYVSWAGGRNVARPGDTILVPRLGAGNPTNAAASGQTTADRFGRDLRLTETETSRPGRPAVDLVIDERTSRDLATIEGVPNLVQAVQARVWTDRGTMPHYPGYGYPPIVGFGATAANITAVKIGLKATLQQDSRVRDVRGLRVTVDGDILAIDADVLPVGALLPTTISTVVV